uniref:Uncharacterized protein n=1 Tax=Panagrolaimus superbus TaxID=310955 RepID=A0A914Y0A3_9BILA
MSLTGSGRFRSVYVDDFDRHSSFSSSGKSGVFNPNGFVNGNNINGNDNNGIISYEPGSGAEYMYSKGWHTRDPYGKPLPTINRSIRNNNNNGGGGVRFDSTKSDDLLARENR